MATLDELEQLEQKQTREEQAELAQIEEEEKDIMSLDSYPGWLALVKELKVELDMLDKQILDINSGLSDKELEHKRIQRHYLNELINMPSRKRELFSARKGYESQEKLATETD